MAATTDIMATYRGPGKVMRRLLGQGPREDRALIYVMVACLIGFVAQTPRLARQAFETQTDLSFLMGGALMGWLFIAPLVLYAVGALTFVVARILRVPITGYGARMALFWALLAASPLMLLLGLTAGFIGPGIERSGVGILWAIAFFWFWFAGFRAARNVPA